MQERPVTESAARLPSAGPAARAVTTTDLLKLVGVLTLLVDHYGLFFDPDEPGWRVFGRIAAPIFFFLIGFARTRSVPWTWIVFGAVLTALDAFTSWEADGLSNVSLNILLNFALLRVAVLPFVERVMLPRPAALALLVAGCVLLIDLSDRFLEYGTGGWLWALFGLTHRAVLDHPGQGARTERLALALTAAAAYVVRETIDNGFSAPQATLLAAMIAALTAGFLAFRRAALQLQPPAPLAPLFRFCGRYSLEIYAITLFAMQLMAYSIDGGSDGEGDDDG